jgi:hypothetical protein
MTSCILKAAVDKETEQYISDILSLAVQPLEPFEKELVFDALLNLMQYSSRWADYVQNIIEQRYGVIDKENPRRISYSRIPNCIAWHILRIWPGCNCFTIPIFDNLVMSMIRGYPVVIPIFAYVSRGGFIFSDKHRRWIGNTRNTVLIGVRKKLAGYPTVSVP